MKKTLITIIVIAIAVVAYYGLRNNTNDTAITSDDQVQGATSTINSTPETAGAAGKKMAFESFIKQGDGSYSCKVSQVISDMENKGTVYIDGATDESKRRIRGEFRTIAEGMTIDSTFIIKDGFNYSWTSFMPKQGFKIAITANSDVAAGSNQIDTSGTYTWNANQIGDYDCQSWAVDEAKFALPSGVTFVEVKK